MTRDDFLAALRECPLIVSAQASDESPVAHPEILQRMALASVQQGVKIVRMEGPEAIQRTKKATGALVIGLIKRKYHDSEIYITPTLAEVDSLIIAGCEAIALDGTSRARPKGASLRQLISRIHEARLVAIADCDTLESAEAAAQEGADIVSTTLAGYTADRDMTDGPDLEVVRQIAASGAVPVLGEGRYAERWQIEAALRCGAVGVVVGSAINDPVKTTEMLMPHASAKDNVGAVDLGGTWMRFGLFSPEWKLIHVEKEHIDRSREGRIDWIKAQIAASQVVALGVSSGGTIHPETGEVWEAKAIIPEHVGTRFNSSAFGIPTVALNDGLATAWGHACLPQFAGKRVATLALGTGVGFGFVSEGKLWMGKRGEYARINDLPSRHGNIEQLLGGAYLGETPSEDQQQKAIEAFHTALQIARTTLFPDVIVVSGGVGLSKFLSMDIARQRLVESPFGEDAGLFGASALALYPPR